MDDDLDAMSRDELSAEVKRLRNAIRQHREATGHDLCWHHPQLWDMLPEKLDPDIAVPPWPKLAALTRRHLRAITRHRDLQKARPLLSRGTSSPTLGGPGSARFASPNVV